MKSLGVLLAVLILMYPVISIVDAMYWTIAGQWLLSVPPVDKYGSSVEWGMIRIMLTISSSLSGVFLLCLSLGAFK